MSEERFEPLVFGLEVQYFTYYAMRHKIYFLYLLLQGDDFKEWKYDIIPTKSWFIPHGLKLTAVDTSDKTIGPFPGTDVYSPISMPDLKKFKVEKDDDERKDVRDYVMICNSKFLLHPF